jgi:transglutaminase-like putative cysteine protease
MPKSSHYARPAICPGSASVLARRVYDIYEDGQWRSSDNLTETDNPETSGLPVLPETGRWIGSFEFVSAATMLTLFTPAQPLWVSRTGQIEYYRSPDGTVDITTLRARPTLDAGQLYAAQSSMTYASEDQLRQAGEDYPAWVKARYLQVPASITLRTTRLAETITEELDNPYDKAVAITNYLRDNMTYVEVIEETTLNQEPVDWFLFDLKKGFCNYYSSAEIMMLRSIGIPARQLATPRREGDVQSAFNPTVEWYHVRSAPTMHMPGLKCISRYRGGV